MSIYLALWEKILVAALMWISSIPIEEMFLIYDAIKRIEGGPLCHQLLLLFLVESFRKVETFPCKRAYITQIGLRLDLMFDLALCHC